MNLCECLKWERSCINCYDESVKAVVANILKQPRPFDANDMTIEEYYKKHHKTDNDGKQSSE